MESDKKIRDNYQALLEKEMDGLTREEKIVFLRGVEFGIKDIYETFLRNIKEMLPGCFPYWERTES